MHYPSDMKFGNSYVSGYEPDWLAGIVVNYSLGLTNKVGSRRPWGVMVKVLNSGFDIIEFELQSRYYIHFQTHTLGKVMNLPMQTMG